MSLYGRDWVANAEGATASETLRQKDHIRLIKSGKRPRGNP
jgi:hypothetical protein